MPRQKQRCPSRAEISAATQPTSWCLEPWPERGHGCAQSPRAPVERPRKARAFALTELGWAMLSPESRARMAAKERSR